MVLLEERTVTFNLLLLTYIAINKSVSSKQAQYSAYCGGILYQYEERVKNDHFLMECKTGG